MRTIRVLFFVSALFVASAAVAQDPAAAKQALQQKVTELKESIAANQAALKTYQWTESTEIKLKGETKKEQLQLAKYGPDGKVQKTPTGPPPAAPKDPPRGLKGRIVENKIDDLKDYVAAMKTLVGQYVPPNKDRIQELFQSGKVTMNPASGGVAALVLNDYHKAGDKVTIGFDSAAKKIKSFTVNTFMEEDKKDVVTLAVGFASLPDGTNYTQQTNLKGTGKQIEINIVNSKYQKVSP